ncbi:hypothetical protein AVEN_243870-1 [Araneus ventricosus]|uniref:Uncharacterized protein n=1 Tax=Araneus ventricosus TaxID=182803 RepID=A0A4Y2R822_ARAVE|nr:hypothetical protein AVEN_243870-1 [Araneus ventricosus]
MKDWGRGGIVVRFRPQGWRVSGTKSDSTEDTACMWARCKLKLMSWVKRPPSGVVRKFGEGVHFMSRPRHLTAVQNDEVRPQIALVLLQNGMLI